MMKARNLHHDRSTQGSALVTVLILMAVLVCLAMSGLVFTRATVSETESERAEVQSLYAAEAGVSAALARLAEAYHTGDSLAPNIGTENAPESIDVGEFWVSITENPDASFTILSAGRSGRADRCIEAIAQPLPPSPLDHAMYAGNLSDDPVYALGLGGTGRQADHVVGDIFSGGDIALEGDASVNGTLRAQGTVTGGAGYGGVKTEIPQILETDYEHFHDYNVNDLFEDAIRKSDDSGGYADQLPSSNPVHFMRRNPSDRTSDTSGTEKDDYFLEDPYERVRSDSRQDGTNAFKLSIPESANNSVIYLDGNLWLHNKKSYSMKISEEGGNPVRVTFVVKGNIYFSDNLFYDDPNLDGVAFIAIADDEVEDSGNIVFGDPVFGTMMFAESLFFAENNFYDNNLDAAGSSSVTLRGCMTAGNQVAIARDYWKSNGSIAHTKLVLNYDERQAMGLLDLPGIPVEQDHPVGYSIVTWREVPVPKTFTPAVDPIEIDQPPAGAPVDDPTITQGEDPTSTPIAEKDWRKRWKKRFAKDWRQKKRRWRRWR